MSEQVEVIRPSVPEKSASEKPPEAQEASQVSAGAADAVPEAEGGAPPPGAAETAVAAEATGATPEAAPEPTPAPPPAEAEEETSVAGTEPGEDAPPPEPVAAEPAAAAPETPETGPAPEAAAPEAPEAGPTPEAAAPEAPEASPTPEAADAAPASPEEPAAVAAVPTPVDGQITDAVTAPPEPPAPAEAVAEIAAGAETEVETAEEAPTEVSPAAEEPAPAGTTEAKTREETAGGEVEAVAEKVGERAAAKKTRKKKTRPRKAPEQKAPEELTEHDTEVLALRQVKEDHVPVEGRVIGWNQGGFHVVVGTVTAFCPRSEMEIKNPKSPSFYLDKSFQFHVIKHQKRGRRIVLSRKTMLAEEREQLAKALKDKLLPGNDLEGRVSSITDFGAFVDLGGLEGLVHITELSSRRVKHPREMVKVGQDVRVRVLRVEDGGERISLSMKVLEPNPWQDFARSHSRGSSFEGPIVRKTDFGLFVEVDSGLDGMVHQSQLPPGKTLTDPDYEVGQIVSGWVLKTEPDRERISLSLKEVPSEDPWKHVGEHFAEGSVVEGEVEDVASFGVFVNLAPGLTGLLPNSVSGVPRGQDVGKQYPPGKRVKVQIASVDPRRRRISLALEGTTLEGSHSDYRDYMRQQKSHSSGGGLNTLAAAFAKLKDQGD